MCVHVQFISTFLAQNCGKRVCSQAALFHVSQNGFNQEFKTELVFNIQLGDLIHKHSHIVTLRCSTEQKGYNLENKKLIEILKKRATYMWTRATAVIMVIRAFCSSHIHVHFRDLWDFWMCVDKQLHFFILQLLPLLIMFLMYILVGKYMYLH